MFEAFSRGYYLGRLYVEPAEETGAVLPDAQYKAVSEQLYDDAEVPVVMKLGRTHFPVSASADLPADTLAVPPGYLDDDRDFWRQQEVFLAKPDRAVQLLRATGETVDGAADGSAPPGASGRSGEPAEGGVTVRTAHRLFRPDDAL